MGRPSAPHALDPWAPRERRRAMGFFAASAAAHAGLLVVLAGVTLQIARKVEEIRVRVLEAESAPEEWEGEPSLVDVAGLLKVSPARARQARPAGPPIRSVKAPDLPRIGGVGPKLGAGPGVEEVPPWSLGAGAIGGLGGSFGDYVGGLRKVGLDVALVVDATESMQFAIDEVQERLTAFVSALRRMVPTARVGIVVYRDHGDEYVVKWADLSFRTEKLVEFLENVTASGGGDWEEAVLEALETAMRELQWRKKAKKIIVLVGGSPPHPWEVERVYDLVRDFRRQGGYVSAMDVTQRLHEEFDRFMWRSLQGSRPYQPSPMPEYYRETARVFREIARLGGGELVALDREKELIREVLVLTFGSRWKVEMANFLRELM